MLKNSNLGMIEVKTWVDEKEFLNNLKKYDKSKILPVKLGIKRPKNFHEKPRPR